MNAVRVVVMACIVGMSLVGQARGEEGATTQPLSPLQNCTDLVLRSVDHAGTLLPEMARAADAAAKRWIQGADIFVGGDDSFTDEAFYRAGGLIALRRIAPFRQKFNGTTMPWDDVPEESVVLYGLHRNVDPAIILFDELGHLAFEKNTVVFFGSKRWPVCQRITKLLEKRLGAEKFFFIDTDLPVDTRLKRAGGVVYGDYAPMATAAHLWAFTAELVAACTRQGKMPAIWPSGVIPKYEVWEKKYEHTRFHDDFTIQPIEAGALGGQYLDVVREQVQACLASAEQVRAAAKLLAAVPADKAVYVMVESHLMAGEAQLPMELPNWLLVQRGYRWRRAAGTVEKNDGILWLGYIDWDGREADRATKQQVAMAAVSVRGPGERIKDAPLVTPADGGSKEPVPPVRPTPRTSPATRPALPESVVWVPAPWLYPDAVVEIPGYPLPACPTSGIVQGTLLYGVIGEVLTPPIARMQAQR
jgi:hypothetical protein